MLNCVCCYGIVSGLMTDELRSFLELNVPKGKEGKKAKFSLGVAEPKLGSNILEETKFPCQSNEFVLELIRGIRLHFERFIKDLKVRILCFVVFVVGRYMNIISYIPLICFFCIDW